MLRRRALQQALDQRVASLAAEIDALQARLEQSWATLRGERAEAQALDRRLDYLVPRVLARQAGVRKLREQAARMLADLASTSRRVQLEPSMRARMLALSPLVLQRLQSAESGQSLRERQSDPLILRREQVERRAPLLIAEAERLQARHEQTRRQRQIVSAQLEQVTTEVQQLSRKEQVLAQRLLDHGVAHSALAGPKADQPALPDRAPRAVAASLVDAAVKGLLPPVPGRAFAARAVQLASQLVAVAPQSVAFLQPDPAAAAGAPALPAAAATPPAAILAAGLGAAARSPRAELAGVTALDLVALRPEPLTDFDLEVAPPGVPRPDAPILPNPAELANPFGGGGDDPKPGISIVAAPGQAVAAPEDGRVVFAGPFKSYGLLLIIEHQREYHTLLWGFSRLEVASGDPVRSGQILGAMAADAERPAELHVELRRNGRPVNPLPWLAASSNKVRG